MSISNLYDLNVNQTAFVKALNGEPALCQRLREMGFCEFAEIKKVMHGTCLVCHVCGVNVALNKHIAQNIVVETIPPADYFTGHPSSR